MNKPTQAELKQQAMDMLSKQIDELTMNGRMPIKGVKAYPGTNKPIIDIGPRGRFTLSLNRINPVELD